MYVVSIIASKKHKVDQKIFLENSRRIGFWNEKTAVTISKLISEALRLQFLLL